MSICTHPRWVKSPTAASLLGADEVIGSYVKATDGWAGHVEDILIASARVRMSDQFRDGARLLESALPHAPRAVGVST